MFPIILVHFQEADSVFKSTMVLTEGDEGDHNDDFYWQQLIVLVDVHTYVPW